ncbi:MAG: SUMF1/EgtB/PvdO family nonheme iron enzyme [Planctomycetota bacterium]
MMRLRRFVYRTALCLTPVVATGFDRAAADPGVSDTPLAGGWNVEHEGRFLTPYLVKAPGTDVEIEMVPVPGGVVRVSVAPFDAEDPAATPEGEEFVEVELPPFWISRHEVTWQSYWDYMELDANYTAIRQLKTLAAGDRRGAAEAALAGRATLGEAVARDPEFGAVDAVTAPTPLYDSSTTYESGREPNLPAVSMTTFAAKQFTKWLSRLTGVDYRLPSEAEWEYAARSGREQAVGADTGDIDAQNIDADEIGARAWYVDNADWVARPVGEKLPNAWGLHDTLGNAAELVLDGARPAGRPELAGKRVGWRAAVAWPEGDYGLIAKGGHYDSEIEELTTTTRLVTNDEWKDADPNLPRSPWWFASYPSNGVGFRIVRPITPIDPTLHAKVWDAAAESVARAVDERLREGRGKIGWLDPALPQALEELDDDAVQSLIK